MASADLDPFTLRLLAETLFYDEEYGAIGCLSLIDLDARQERYIASFMPDDGALLVEEATAWEADDEVAVDEDEDADGIVAYALAVDSTIYGRYDRPDEAAAVLLTLARAHDLLPSFTLLFEDDEL